ncbi:DNA-binding protein MNB1B-like [Triticum urartu]|uniref:DNA-binding protein MNB1B-like n=1 Tax=Triticum urartu TaxID=4572 RepID=UPI002042C7DA|nr:DNA-binding protein MNB1B-like [Triticum urartu]
MAMAAARSTPSPAPFPRCPTVGLANVGKSTFFNIVTKVGSRAGNSRRSRLRRTPTSPRAPECFLHLHLSPSLGSWDNFRKEYKEKHPDVKQVSVIGKAGGEKWKSMSDAQVLCSCTRLAPSPAWWCFLRRLA